MSGPPGEADRVAIRADLHGARAYGAPQLDVAVRLNTNETPYPPPPAFIAGLAERLGGLALHRYPDRDHHALRAALAARFEVDPAGVWAANGSNEVLAQLLTAYGGPGRRVLATAPGFPALATIARASGTEVVTVDLHAPGYDLEPARAAAAVARHAPSLICLARPNNPTGTSVSLAALEALHDAGDALLIVDEAYAEFAADDARSLLDRLPRVVLTRTFSKAFRLAGLRLGYLLGPAWVVQDLQLVRLPYHLDAITQTAGVLACEQADELTAHIARIVDERERITSALRARTDLTVIPSQANFVLLTAAATDLFDRLLAVGVLVRDVAEATGVPGSVRVTVGTPAENDRFLSALEEVLP